MFFSLLSLQLSCVGTPGPFDETRWRTDVEQASPAALYAPHFEAGRYFNPWLARQHGGFWRFWQWKLSKKIRYTKQEEDYLPAFIPDLKKRIQAGGDGDFIAWIGHSTFLMRLQGEFWLTDPMFSDRALLPKRFTPPALSADDVGEISQTLNVLISHNHYDHLDASSIRDLPAKTRFFVPLGLKTTVASLHPGEIVELDWWQERTVGRGQRVICLPAQHWSRRIGQDTDTTLWASFMLLTDTTAVYYGGDSGYFVGYREFGRKFPHIDYALMPVTAYHPRWFMHYAHMNVPEVLDAFRELGARYFIPTQWGTFRLGDNPPGYPALDLERHIKERKLDPTRFRIMAIGQLEHVSAENRH